MEGRCLPCISPFNGEEEEEEKDGEKKFSSRALRVRTAATAGLDLPSRSRGGDGGIANGTHKQALQDGVLEGSGSSRYTSLRDLLAPPALPFPTAAARPHGREVAIRNRLVKQAACAYLQPAGASSPRSSRGRGCLRWLRWELEGCVGFVAARVLPAVRRAFGCLLARFRGTTVRQR